MYNKVIKLVILGSFFPLLLIGCNQQSSNDKQNIGDKDSGNNNTILYQQVEDKYEILIKDFAPQGELLTQLAKASSDEIALNNISNITDNLEQFKTAVKKLETNISGTEKTKIQEILNVIETPQNDEQFNLASFVALLKDNKLEKDEICDKIQVPLKIVAQDNRFCGSFGKDTYNKLENVLGTEISKLETNINSLQSSNSSNEVTEDNLQRSSNELLNNNQLLTLIIIMLILNIISIILVILFLKLNNEKAIKSLEIEISKNNRLIKTAETSNNKRKSEITNLTEKIKGLGELIKAEYSDIQLQLRQLEVEVKNNSSNDIHTSYYPTDQVIIQKDQENNQDNDSPISLNKDTVPQISEEEKLANFYKENPQEFFSNYNPIRVSMTKDTVNNVSAGTWEDIVELEANNRNGEYLIVSDNNGQIYVFLNGDTLFNPPTLQQINKSKLFMCNGNLSQTLKGHEINIIRPAIVIKDNHVWRLTQSGEIHL